ncbi:zinc-ribbon domain-containing protein [Halalkalibacter kiskunsagensis]|uniref:Zinc-ribbon domain-containing protein n=1 Tax=Halalkalibacter kiskunsagensis TaxID=1548599 RepID=A0ABV6K765_9BACI
MFCHHCGEKLADSSRFCSNCGKKVVHETQQSDNESTSEHSDFDHSHFPIETTNQSDLAATIEETPDEEPSPTAQVRSKRKNRSGIFKKLPILIPIISLLLCGGGVSAYYVIETNTNEDVLMLQQSAEAAALEGDYTKAEKDLRTAQELRPAYAVLEQDLQAINRAASYNAALVSISDHIKKQKFKEAETELTTLKIDVESEVDPLFESFAELIAASEVTVTVGKVKQELSELTMVQELADKLNILHTLSSDESAKVKEQIIMKIVQITNENAEVHLQNKQFSDALSSVNKGLEYSTDNDTLLAFKEKIKQEQAAFEQAETKRIERAMEAAAKEDLQNRTAAVDITFFEAEVDEFGDLFLYGKVTNVATKDISQITIYYTVYDLDGVYLYDSWTSVYPYSLRPGEQGSFDDVVYYLYEDVNVEIDNITWYLE